MSITKRWVHWVGVLAAVLVAIREVWSSWPVPPGALDGALIAVDAALAYGLVRLLGWLVAAAPKNSGESSD